MPTAGDLLRDARVRVDLSQVELAARAGVPQSVISVYESGKRQPSLETLEAMIAATGFELDVRLKRSANGLRKLNGPHGRVLRRRRKDLAALGERHCINIVGVFGSVARGEDRPNSDVDLLVELPDGMGIVGLGRFRREVEHLLGAKVDLVPDANLKRGVRENVYADLVRL